MIAVCVLDVVELHRDEERITVRPGKTTEVLIRLALEAGHVVRTERLIEDLWAGGASGTARNTLQTKVSRLRRALGDTVPVKGSSEGYTLEVDPGAVDALAVLQLAEQATSFRNAGDAAAALETSTAALGMFGAEILMGAGSADWVVPHRVRLEEVRLGLVEDQLAARLDLGASGDVTGELESLVHLHPLREGLWALLMVAMYRDGRQSDALAAYQLARNTLGEELGLDPGLQLQQLEHQILVHDVALGLPSVLGSGLGPAKPPGNLPGLTADLVGRADELAEVVDLVGNHRLVEVVGPGGVGKTALAIDAGRALSAGDLAPGGVWLARLEGASTTDEVIDAVVAAVGVGGEEALFERLKIGDAILILDNCEHIIDEAALLAGRLLDVASGLRLLCTSQVALDIDGETVFELEPLDTADAVTLFLRRAGAQRNRPTTTTDQNVAELCQSLDGLPLAIELAAARTKTLSVDDIIRRLTDRFTVLHDPTSRRPERRRALKSTIAWSYDLLFPDDQRGLWALATFSDGAPLLAVESVLEALDVPATAAIDVVGRLVSRSLVVVDVTTSMTVRYRLLDSVRAYALEALHDSGLADRGFAAHAAWFVDAAGSSTEGVRSSHQAEHLAFARDERANIDAALTWSIDQDPLRSLAIANGFGWAWVVLGDSRGAQRILSALDAAGDLPPATDRAQALLLAAWIKASTGRLEHARDHIREASDIADAIAHVDLQARSSYYLAYVVSHEGQWHQALELTERSAALYDTLDRPWDQAANSLFAARAANSAGDAARAALACASVRHWLQSVDDPWLESRSEAVQGEFARVEHRFDDAVAHLSVAARTSDQLGFKQTEAYQLSSLGRAQCQAEDYRAGAATLEFARDKAEATGDVRLTALIRVHLGRVRRALGDIDAARTALEMATRWHREVGGGELAAMGECLLAALDAVEGVSEVDIRLSAILEDARVRGDAPVEVLALDALARIATDAGDESSARRLGIEADRRMRSASHFITELDRVDARSVRDTSRGQGTAGRTTSSADPDASTSILA